MDNPALLDARKPMQKLRRFLLLLILLVAATSTYAWYSIYRACEVSAVEKASVLLVRQRDRYDHTYQFATSASRDATVRPVAELQQILMDTQQVGVPVCMQTAKDELIDYMGTVIRAFDAFGAQETDSTVRELINQSETHYDNFATEVEAVKACAPLCIP
jgi:hypothetical protein